MIIWIILFIFALVLVFSAWANASIKKEKAQKKRDEKIYVICPVCSVEDGVDKKSFQQAAAKHRLSKEVKDQICMSCNADISAEYLKHPFIRDLFVRMENHRMNKAFAEELLPIVEIDEEAGRPKRPKTKTKRRN